MTIHINSTSVLVHLPAVYGQYSAFKSKLVSRYNNKEINNDEANFIVTTFSKTGYNWTEFELTLEEKWAREIDLGGYYDFELYGFNGSSYVLIDKYLCKVTNDYDVNNPPTNWISNNEDNEQYVYFINE